jgi:hypothetical protein
MASNGIGKAGHRRPQFGLRTLLIVVAAVAVLLAQWPFVEECDVDLSHLTRTVITKSDGTVDEEAMAALGPLTFTTHRLKKSFLVVLIAETGLVVGWLLWTAAKKRSARLRLPGE